MHKFVSNQFLILRAKTGVLKPIKRQKLAPPKISVIHIAFILNQLLINRGVKLSKPSREHFKLLDVKQSRCDTPGKVADSEACRLFRTLGRTYFVSFTDIAIK